MPCTDELDIYCDHTTQNICGGHNLQKEIFHLTVVGVRVREPYKNISVSTLRRNGNVAEQ